MYSYCAKFPSVVTVEVMCDSKFVRWWRRILLSLGCDTV